MKLEGKTPYYFYQGEYRPICGPWFWDSNNGATAFCKKLGHEEGIVVRVREVNDQDAFHVGKCNPGDDITSCTGGDNTRDLKNFCRKREKISIEIECLPGSISYILVYSKIS